MSRARQFLPLTGVLAAVALVLAGCGGGGAATSTPKPATPPQGQGATPQATATPAPGATKPAAAPRYGGTLQARAYYDYTTWNSYDSLGGFTNDISMNILTNLIQYKKDSVTKLVGDAAESWEVSNGGKAITFRLRKNVQWHDGKPLTAADVQYTFSPALAFNPKYPFNKSRLAALDTVETPDAYTVKMNLKRASQAFLPQVATPSVMIYPAHIPIEGWQDASVGSGPFIFVRHDKDKLFVLKKNPNWFAKDDAGRQLPYLDGLNFNTILDPTLALSAFRAGRLQCGCGYDHDFLTEQLEQLLKDVPGSDLKIEYSHPQGVFFNLKRAPFDNLAFRQALGIGLDKKEVAATWHQGKAFYPATQMLAPELGGQWGLPKAELEKIPGFNPDHSKDVEIAKQKLKESGVDLSKLTFDYVSSNYFRPRAEIVGTVWAALGVKINPISPPTGEVASRRQTSNYDMVETLTSAAVDDPSDTYIDILSKDGIINYPGYFNARIEQLLADQDSEADPAKRRQMLWEVQRLELTDWAHFVLFWNGVATGTRPEVHGFVHPKLLTKSSFRLDELWVDQ